MNPTRRTATHGNFRRHMTCMMIATTGNDSSPVRSPRRSRTTTLRKLPTTHIRSRRRTSTPGILPAGKAIPSPEPPRRSHRGNLQSDPLQKEARSPGPRRFPIRTARAQGRVEPPIRAVRQNRAPRRGLLEWRTLRLPCLPRPQNCPGCRRNDRSKNPLRKRRGSPASTLAPKGRRVAMTLSKGSVQAPRHVSPLSVGGIHRRSRNNFPHFANFGQCLAIIPESHGS